MKVGFAYFGFSSGGAPDRTKACLLLLAALELSNSKLLNQVWPFI
jgi:hypothetical protein